ncbi:MAG: capsular polysaccharide biosynthesis protein [Cellvibrionaceae bacterium]
MIRLIIIRISESIVRNFFLIIAPAIIVTLLVAAFQLTHQPEYLSGATIQIQTNDAISAVIEYEKFKNSQSDPSSSMIYELQELIWTNSFIDKVIARVDFNDYTGKNPVASTQNELREHIRDNVEFFNNGRTQIGFIAYMPTESAAIGVVNAIYEEYLNHQIETFRGTGQSLVAFMSIYLEEKIRYRDLVNEELVAYLQSHPEHPVFNRRDIEEDQIALLVSTRRDLLDDIESIQNSIDSGLLVERTSERYFKETFILLDAPFAPIQMTTTSKKISKIIQGAAAGVFLSIIVIGLTILFDRRIILPLDLQNTTNIPLLTMVEMEKDRQKQQSNFRVKREPFIQRLQNRIKQVVVIESGNDYKGLQQDRRPNKNLNSIR